MLTRRSTAVLSAACLLAAPAAMGQCLQTGAFHSFAQRWTASNGSTGHAFPNASTMTVDTNGNGLVGGADTGDHTYTLPTEAQSNRLSTALSPTREFFVLVGGTAGACPSNRTVRIYKLTPSTTSIQLIHESCLPCTVFEGPLFYDLGATAPNPFPPPITSQRIVLFRTGDGTACSPSNLSPPLLRWFDLNTPGPSGIADTALGLEAGINSGTLRVSPSGYQAFVQHALTTSPFNSDFDIINLCPGSDFGEIVPNEIGPQINDWTTQPLPTASIVSASASEIVVQMAVGINPPIFSATLANCCAGATLGACCINGGCTITTEANCAGTWNAGLTCEQANCPPPPSTILSITMTGPATVPQQTEFDYTLTFQNTGGLSAQNTTVTDVLPAAFTFVSASHGGTYDAGAHRVTWTIGTLPGPSGPQNRTLRARTGCTTSFYSNSNYRILATGFNILGSPPVNTGVTTAPVVGSISGTFTTTPTGPEPLAPGTIVHHVMTITNTSAEQLTDIKWNGYAGNAAPITALVNHGTGTLTLPFSNGTAIDWVGNLAPWQSTTIEFDATVNACASPSTSVTHTNAGQAWTVRTHCGGALGSFPTSPPMNLLVPMTASLGAAAIPGVVGPVVPPVNPGDTSVQVIRGMPNVDLVLGVANHLGVDSPGASFAVELPSSWIINNPPFIGTPPAGFSYDENSRMVNYAGTLPAAGLPPVTIRIQPPAPFVGTQYITVTGAAAPQCSGILAEHKIVGVPETPTGPFVLGVEKWFSGGTWTVRPGIDPLPNPFFSTGEVWYGLHHAANGDIWLAGAPTFMFNPFTLDTATTPGIEAFLDGLGLDTSDACDVAVDPIDGTLVISTQRRAGNPTGAPPALFRYDPATETCTLITRDPILAAEEHHADVLIDAAGDIFVCNRHVLARIPRAMPVPIPDGQVPLIAVPHPAYSFAPEAGVLTSQKPHAIGWSCDGRMLLLHATLFTGSADPENYATNTTLYALSTYDPATNTIAVAQPQVAATAYSQAAGPRPLAAPFTPQLPFDANMEDSCITGGEFNKAIIANNYYPYHCIYELDLAGGPAVAIEVAEMWHFRAAADIAYLNGTCAQPCDGDVNCDFALDGFDVETMERAVGGDTSDFCQTDPDFNGDFALDGFDVEAVELVVGGGPCP